MSYLLDTHTFLWFVAGDKNLPAKIVERISNINEYCFISIASFWEIAIKIQLGKLQIDISFDELFRFAERNQIEVITINETHLSKLLTLNLHHNDPFNRIIIPQAITEKLVLISKDRKIGDYNIEQEWA